MGAHKGEMVRKRRRFFEIFFRLSVSLGKMKKGFFTCFILKKQILRDNGNQFYVFVVKK